MAVKKKVSTGEVIDDTIDLSRNLAKVREAISNLPDEENMEPTSSTEALKSAPKKVTKKPVAAAPAKKTVAKKAEPKKAEKKADAPAKKDGADLTTLADICKSLKMDPRVARKILRKKNVAVDGGRWAWPAKDVAKIQDILISD